MPRHGLLGAGSSPGCLFGSFLWTSALVVLPATFVMGLSFPAASALVAGSDEQVGGRAGLLLSANTLGAIAGTFIVPFAVIPLIGAPAARPDRDPERGPGGHPGPARWPGHGRRPSAIAGAGTAGGRARLAVVGVGSFFVDPSIARIERTGGTVLHSAEDEIASVQAGVDKNGTKHLWVTGTAMTLLTIDAKLMPVLPLIARPDSKTAAVVAFGMGSAFRGALIAGLKTDAVELVPSVPKMFGTYYDDAASVLANPNGRVIIADGRNHIELTDRHYDIIVTDPPPPIESAGVSVISSREYYAAGKARLNPGGVMMQWVPWGQTLDEFLAHVRSFRAVYPEVLIAFGPGGYGLFMLGSDQPIAFDPANVAGDPRPTRRDRGPVVGVRLARARRSGLGDEDPVPGLDLRQRRRPGGRRRTAHHRRPSLAGVFPPSSRLRCAVAPGEPGAAASALGQPLDCARWTSSRAAGRRSNR